MKLLIALLFASLACAGRCDYDPTSISWKGWKIESSEDLWAGKTHSSYPLTNLIDDDPATAWVFSGNWSRLNQEERKRMSGHYSLTICNEGEQLIDEIRIMNGYNKSPEVFAKNDRIKEIALYGWLPGARDQKLLCQKTLKDEMGWQSIAFSPKRYESLTIEFSSRYPGTEHDLCVSGIELYSKGKKIDWTPTKLFLHTEGSECGCGSEYQLIDSWGKFVDGLNNEEQTCCLSADGRYAQIYTKNGCNYYDMATGTLILGPVDEGGDSFEVRGRTMIIASSNICVYDLSNKKLIFECENIGEPKLMGKDLLAVESDGQHRLYDIPKKRLLADLVDYNIAFSPDGRYYAQSVDWQRRDYIKIYDLKTKRMVLKKQVKDTDNEIVWKDARTVVSKSDPSVSVRLP